MTDIFTLAREAAGEPFVFQVDDEQTLTLTHIGDLDQFELAALIESESSDVGYITGLLTMAAGDDADALRALRLPRPSLLKLHRAYMAHCGASAGESSASSS